MGICIQQLDKGPAMEDNAEDYNLKTNWIWIVFRRDANVSPPQWHLQGVGSNETSALQMCLDENYMLGPVPIDTSLSNDRIEWAGAYFPHARK